MEAREARRRRIVERGTDRLAFITGQSRSLTSSSPPQREDPDPIVALLTKDDATDSESPKQQARDQIVSSTMENDELFQKCEISGKFPKFEMNSDISAREKDDEILNYEKNNGTPTNEPNYGRNMELLTTSMVDRSSYEVGDSDPSISRERSRRIFTPSQISATISATENIRLLCAILVALLVVLSYHGYSLGQFIGSIITFRPLFLVLLTDATVVYGWLLAIQGSNNRHEGDTNRTRQEEYSWANDMSKVLEVGLVFQKALGAAFLDCSICAVVMIMCLVL